MKYVLVSQRVDISAHGERRDALDQRWARLLAACGLIAIPVPNLAASVAALFSLPDLAGVLLTGGNDLPSCGGDVPERDATEAALLDAAGEHNLPVLGVCHGMQVIQSRYGVALEAVTGHVMPEQDILIEGVRTRVNSYHRYGARSNMSELHTWAIADDGVIKAVRHAQLPLLGIMWHPERIEPWAARDCALIRQHFGVTT